ncbi:MAG TPA: rod shape-determining protein [Micromonospora sp.]
MLAVGAYARRGVRHPLAIDLGTSMVRIWAPGLETVVNEPAVVAFGPVPDQRAAGRAAFEVARRTGAPLIWPVRDGVVDNLAACVYLLRTLVAATGRPADDPSPVVVGVPATATLRQLHLIMTAVHHATGGRVSAVEEPLAAALACFPRLDDGDDVVAVDIGQGRTEVIQIADRAVAAAERVDARGRDLIPAIAETVRRIAPCGSRRPRRLLVTGGGATRPGAATSLAALTGRTVTVPAEARLATLRGLSLLLSTADSHPQSLTSCRRTA